MYSYWCKEFNQSGRWVSKRRPREDQSNIIQMYLRVALNIARIWLYLGQPNFHSP